MVAISGFLLLVILCFGPGASGTANAIAANLVVLNFCAATAADVALRGGNSLRLLSVVPMSIAAWYWSSEVPIITDPIWGPSVGRLNFVIIELTLLVFSLGLTTRRTLRCGAPERVVAVSVALIGLASNAVVGSGRDHWAALSDGAIATNVARSATCASRSGCSMPPMLFVEIRSGRSVLSSQGFLAVTERDGTVLRAMGRDGSRWVPLHACPSCSLVVGDLSLVLGLANCALLAIVVIAWIRERQSPSTRAVV